MSIVLGRNLLVKNIFYFRIPNVKKRQTSVHVSLALCFLWNKAISTSFNLYSIKYTIASMVHDTDMFKWDHCLPLSYSHLEELNLVCDEDALGVGIVECVDAQQPEHSLPAVLQRDYNERTLTLLQLLWSLINKTSKN